MSRCLAVCVYELFSFREVCTHAIHPNISRKLTLDLEAGVGSSHVDPHSTGSEPSWLNSETWRAQPQSECNATRGEHKMHREFTCVSLYNLESLWSVDKLA